MGYSTYFDGHFDLDRPLAPEHKAYLEAFSITRRMQRDERVVAARPDPRREALGLPVGPQGAYYVADECYDEPDVTNPNTPPEGQPGLWCEWSPNDHGTAITCSTALTWGGDAAFSEYERWIAYLIEHFLEPWGYTLNGVVDWSGEEAADLGRIVVDNNTIRIFDAEIIYVERAA